MLERLPEGHVRDGYSLLRPEEGDAGEEKEPSAAAGQPSGRKNHHLEPSLNTEREGSEPHVARQSSECSQSAPRPRRELQAATAVPGHAGGLGSLSAAVPVHPHNSAPVREAWRHKEEEEEEEDVMTKNMDGQATRNVAQTQICVIL